MTTTTPRPTILEVLQISYMTYDNYREKQYQAYCERLAAFNSISYKILHSNDFMQNYFCDMWLLHVEKAFMRDNAAYFKMCEPELLRSLFAEYTRNIIDGNKVEMYPAKLIEQIRKNNLQKIAK